MSFSAVAPGLSGELSSAGGPGTVAIPNGGVDSDTAARLGWTRARGPFDDEVARIARENNAEVAFKLV